MTDSGSLEIIELEQKFQKNASDCVCGRVRSWMGATLSIRDWSATSANNSRYPQSEVHGVKGTKVGCRIKPKSRKSATTARKSARVWPFAKRARTASSMDSTALVTKRHPVSRNLREDSAWHSKCSILIVTS